ncbi:MAG: OmpH family outer membrane protein [Culturomica sp.]|jgi:outer membrane protein|nr:OmpH family outer membrane protein [Culturomica sp.]
MKNYSIILYTVLVFAVAILYILYFTSDNQTNEVKSDGTVVVKGKGASSIVYINTDTLLNKYQLAIDLNEAFLKKQEERSTELNIQAKDLDRQATEFQRKLENNGFLTRARAESEKNDILRKQQQFEQLRQELTDKMMKEQSDIYKRLIEDITKFLKAYNAQKGYDIVLSTTASGTVFYAEKGFDITNEVVNELNAGYKKSAK